MQTQTIHFNFTGGIVSPGYLKQILEIAATCKVSHVRFGLRQQMVMDVPTKYLQAFCEACNEKDIAFYTSKDAPPNTVSSYPAADIFTAESWLREGVYKDVFNSFDYTSRLKVNICDKNQSLVPFFTGHINWISSASQHFWHLYIRFPKTQEVYNWPQLIYTNDLPVISKYLENLLVDETSGPVDKDKTGAEYYRKISSSVSYVSKPKDHDLVLPKFSLPYYEGFNRMDSDFWLGIYRRDESYAVPFLIDICAICLDTKIGQMYTTPWKSLIIKGIETFEKNKWEYILGKYRINVRHAANELNWQVEDKTEDGLIIKRHVIRHFDKEDVRTYGLSFAVQTRLTSSMFGSVIIRKQELKNPDRLKSLDRFDILYKKDFNPNSSNLQMFRQNVEKEHLGTYLVSLCKFFYERESHIDVPADITVRNELKAPSKTSTMLVHQCKHCLTVYNEALGDEENNIAPGTSFHDLPSSYTCPLCEAEKDDFITVEETSLRLQSV